jgi:hypothetical protein
VSPGDRTMDIEFTEEQELLRDTARRFLESECSTQFVRRRMAEPGRPGTHEHRDFPRLTGPCSWVPGSRAKPVPRNDNWLISVPLRNDGPTEQF